MGKARNWTGPRLLPRLINRLFEADTEELWTIKAQCVLLRQDLEQTMERMAVRFDRIAEAMAAADERRAALGYPAAHDAQPAAIERMESITRQYVAEGMEAA